MNCYNWIFKFSVFIFVILIWGICAPASSFVNSGKKEYLKSRAKIGYQWEFSLSPELFQAWQGREVQYEIYREWVQSHNPGDFQTILQKHLDAGRKILSKLNPEDKFAKSILEDEKFILQIIRDFKNNVGSLNNIESVVFREFIKSNDNIKSRKEFLANFFQKGQKIKVFAEWNTGKEADDFSGATESAELKQARAKLLAEGWVFQAHYHNHPFNFENSLGDIGGGLAPSDTDLVTYRTLKPEIGVITNGIDSIRFDKSLWNLKPQ